MHDDDELPHIERATTSGILEFFADAEKLMPRKYTATLDNSELLDLLFKRRASHGSTDQFDPDPRLCSE